MGQFDLSFDYIFKSLLNILIYQSFCAFQSVVARALLNSVQEKEGYVLVYINFSAQTSSARTQEIIESKLEKKRKNILGKGHLYMNMLDV